MHKSPDAKSRPVNNLTGRKKMIFITFASQLLYSLQSSVYSCRRGRCDIDLFFCNFSLGYRTGSQSGGMTGRVMNQDAPYIKKLIEIIKPEKILCLGQKTANATLKMLFGKVPRYKNYGSLVDSKKVYTYINGDVHSTVYPLFHTGFYGVRNRKGGLDKHFEDWSRIK